MQTVIFVFFSSFFRFIENNFYWTFSFELNFRKSKWDWLVHRSVVCSFRSICFLLWIWMQSNEKLHQMELNANKIQLKWFFFFFHFFNLPVRSGVDEFEKGRKAKSDSNWNQPFYGSLTWFAEITLHNFSYGKRAIIFFFFVRRMRCFECHARREKFTSWAVRELELSIPFVFLFISISFPFHCQW